MTRLPLTIPTLRRGYDRNGRTREEMTSVAEESELSCWRIERAMRRSVFRPDPNVRNWRIAVAEVAREMAC